MSISDIESLFKDLIMKFRQIEYLINKREVLKTVKEMGIEKNFCGFIRKIDSLLRRYEEKRRKEAKKVS